jgi:hypothetical protein
VTDPTEQIIGFLESVGLPVAITSLDDDTFLPGIQISSGSLLLDPARLRYPGDVLHEAGHLAVLPPDRRQAFGDDGELGPADMQRLEIQAMAWSYAAALHLKLDPAVVFHEGGYRGHAGALLRSFTYGASYGVADLEAAGMTARPDRAAELGIEPYPHMITWLRP